MTSTDLVPMDAEIAQTPANLFGTQNPVEVVARSTEIAKALADVLSQRQLAKKIGNRSFVLVEGWTLLGTMLGVFPVVEWTRSIEDGWEARVEARTLNGQVVGAAEAECLRSEKNWKNRDDYALRSMAQTRAVSKALRGPLGFIVELAGYSATPAEEIPDEAGPIADFAALDAVLEELKAMPLPEGRKSWDGLARDFAKEQFGSPNREKLSQEQVDELVKYLNSYTIPL